MYLARIFHMRYGQDFSLVVNIHLKDSADNRVTDTLTITWTTRRSLLTTFPRKTRLKSNFLTRVDTRLRQNTKHGFSKRGEKCIEVGRCMPNPNITLNCLVGLTGVQYHNFVDGPSNAHHFVYFWQEAVKAYTDDGFPVLSPGDVVIVDNCPIHRFAAGNEVGLFLQDQGIEYLFLPRYSPDLNPCENCFLKSKTLLRNERMAELAFKNLKVAVTETLNKINCVDMLHFYRATGYLNC